MINIQDPIKEPESIVKVRFQDCDPFGHLNNARFIDYFLNARQDQLAQHYNLSTYEANDPARASWVIRQTHIAYLQPVPAMTDVLIRTRLINYTETSLVVEGLMLDREARHLKAIVWFEFVYVSLANGRPLSQPAELMELFRAVLVPGVYQPSGFNRRVEAARRPGMRKHGSHEERAGSAERGQDRAVQRLENS